VTDRVTRVGMLGCGTVGSAVARTLAAHGDDVARRAGVRIEITRVAVRDVARHRDVPLTVEVFTADPLSIVDDPNIDVVVELLGGLEPARQLVERALATGKPVVTGNKELIAAAGAELEAAAHAGEADLAYEAAVAGGIPLIRPLRESLAGDRVTRILGVVNGTTNYILTQMAHGASFQDALSTAQKLGYAEADPGDDVDAVDAADKLAILVRIAFGVSCTPREIFREGVRSLDPVDIAYGREMGYALKLLASARRANGGIEARVHPAFVSLDHPLARVDGARNAVHLLGDLCGPVMFSGLGAGGDATASAVLADLTHVARRLALGDEVEPPRPEHHALPVLPMDQVHGRSYLRLSVDDVPGVFAQITHVLAEAGIGLASVIQREPVSGQADVVLMTYSAPEGAMREALTRLAALPCTHSVRARIRVEESKA
jgi:homoserine dehydrogenase